MTHSEINRGLPEGATPLRSLVGNSWRKLHEKGPPEETREAENPCYS
jgi:hypothetical protein